MKGKSLTFRPKLDHRARLEKLAAAGERDITLYVEKCIEAHLPELEKHYSRELKEYDTKMSQYPPTDHNPASLNDSAPLNSSTTSGGGGSTGKLAENLGNALLGKEVRPERPTSKPLSYRSKPRPLRKK